MATRTHIARQEEGVDEKGVQIRNSDPGTPTSNQFWLNTNTNELKFFDGSTGVSVGGGGGAGVTGPQGPTGPAGGPQGDTGVQGETGLLGSTGVQGPQGSTGPAGETGVLGNTGIQGVTGISGVSNEFDNGASGSSLNIDFLNGASQRVLLDANVTLTLSNPFSGGAYVLRLEQDGVGGHTVTWPLNVLWPGGVAPTLSTAPNAIDLISLYYDGTDFYGSFSLGY